MILKEFIPEAKKRNAIIYFDEWHDPRVYKAARYLQNNNILTPVFIGSGIPSQIQKKFKCLDPEHVEAIDELVRLVVRLRKRKLMTRGRAEKLLKKPLYLGAALLRSGRGHGMVSGATHTTAESLLPALQLLRNKRKRASSYFLMVKEDTKFVFADCALIQNPDPRELAHIAFETAESARKAGIIPRVALLSHSTKGSASHPDVKKVKKAASILRTLKPKFIFDGEMQFDAAIVPHVGESKAKGSPINGNANVFIFPDLDAGNIGYKIAERLGGFHAVGPLVQGLLKPFNDLSRGCNWEDIVNTAIMTSVESK